MTFEIGLIPVLHALLGSIRVFTMMLTGPIFSHPALSMRVRMMLAVMIAWVAGPVGVEAIAGTEWGVLDVAAAVGVEVLVGMSIGIGSGLIFSAILQLGEFVAIQGGLGAARSIDPSSGASSVAIGMALNTMALMVFLAIDGHHELVRGITASFTTFPVGGRLPSSETLLAVAQLGNVIWEYAFQLAAPITVAIFVQNMTTGLLARAMPQLNLLMVNLPLHVGTLLLIIGLGANDLTHAFKDLIEVWPSRVIGMILGGAHG